MENKVPVTAPFRQPTATKPDAAVLPPSENKGFESAYQTRGMTRPWWIKSGPDFVQAGKDIVIYSPLYYPGVYERMEQDDWFSHYGELNGLKDWTFGPLSRLLVKHYGQTKQASTYWGFNDPIEFSGGLGGSQPIYLPTDATLESFKQEAGFARAVDPPYTMVFKVLGADVKLKFSNVSLTGVTVDLSVGKKFAGGDVIGLTNTSFNFRFTITTSILTDIAGTIAGIILKHWEYSGPGVRDVDDFPLRLPVTDANHLVAPQDQREVSMVQEYFGGPAYDAFSHVRPLSIWTSEEKHGVVTPHAGVVTYRDSEAGAVELVTALSNTGRYASFPSTVIMSTLLLGITDLNNVSPGEIAQANLLIGDSKKLVVRHECGALTSQINQLSYVPY